MKFNGVSLAVALLLSSASALNIKSYQGLGDQLDNAAAMTQRYINARGEPINLAETTGHARVELRREPKYLPGHEEKLLVSIRDDSDVIADGRKCTAEDMKGIGHCPTNSNGPQEVKVFQENLDNYAYISDIYVGNPPQKLRALFDTGSTNTWVLNSKTKLPGDPIKEYAYDDDKSCSFKRTNQRAYIKFGSGALMGHFIYDDFRVGSCEG